MDSSDNIIGAKTKADRVKEGVYLLKQIKDLGVTEFSAGFAELKEVIRVWVTDGKRWEGTIRFPAYQRKAEVMLPFRASQTATLAFKRTLI